MRPDALIFSVFSFFYSFRIFSFCYSLLFRLSFYLFLFFLFFSSYPSLLISSYSSRKCYSFKVWWPNATLFAIIFFLYSRYIHTSFIHSQTFAEAHLHIFTAVSSVGGTSMGCRAEIRTRACLTASQQYSYTIHLCFHFHLFRFVLVDLLFVSVQSKHRNSLFWYRSETTETNVLFRIVPKLVSVPVSVVSNRN